MRKQEEGSVNELNNRRCSSKVDTALSSRGKKTYHVLLRGAVNGITAASARLVERINVARKGRRKEEEIARV